jgi:ABC-type branched-subunit amino acid transport system substrate-binding protein
MLHLNTRHYTGSITWLFILISLICISAGNALADETEPVYIGVLLPLTGPDGKPMLDALNLGVEQINAGGGIGGHPVSLILRDTRTGDIRVYAEELANDKRIRVVIGPFSSDDLFYISDTFIDNYKVLVSPTASSDEIFRAFATTGSVWRTISNDGDITSVIMQHIAGHDGKSVALLTPNSSYGKTFWDWIPFWAIETGIQVIGAEEFTRPDQIPIAIRNLTASHPDYLVFVHSGNSDELPLAIHALEQAKVSTGLYLVYPNIDEKGHVMERMNTSSLFSTLVSGQWILQNSTVSTTAIPDDTLILLPGTVESDFVQEFEHSSGTKPTGYAPQVYDALLISSEIMARFLKNPDKSPRNAALTILGESADEPLPRSIEGFQDAFTRIMNNETVVMTGATGPLTFRSEGTDRLVPRFDSYRMEEGSLIADPLNYREILKTDTDNKDLSNDGSSSEEQIGNFSQDNYWAVIGALSRDWENYRHQADALTVYQYVKKQGVLDDHIILLIYDDIPIDAKNVKPGEVYHTPGEVEVRKYANPDYIGDKVNKQMLEDILFGSEAREETPQLQSDENSTVLVYLSSHGAQGGFMVLGDGEDFIAPEEFTSIIEKMAENKKFGRMLVILESCFSGATAAEVNTPDVIVLTAASVNETSKASTYDSGLSNWLSDEFTNQVVTLMETQPASTSIRDFYHTIYQNVRSSHPMIIKGNTSLEIPARVYFGGNI